jgi:uncharacterized membrane protein YphA (DoxX/SURF4 family)
MRALAVDVANYRLAPEWAVPALAAALPGMEVVCGACLLVGRWVRPAAWLAALMMVVFSIAKAQAMMRGINLDCGCFGSGRSPVTVMTLVRDLALLAAALATIWTAPRERTSAGPASNTSQP